MKIRWSPDAAEDLERIVRRIQTDNPAAAWSVAHTIIRRIESLVDSPHRGRVGRIRGSRELVFAPLPYTAVLQSQSQLHRNPRIYHGAQDW